MQQVRHRGNKNIKTKIGHVTQEVRIGLWEIERFHSLNANGGRGT